MVRRTFHDDRGAGYLAAFIVLFGVLAVAGVGLLVDSARLLASGRQVDTIALEAARAGANAIDVELLRAGSVGLEPSAAQAAAHAAAAAFVSGSGADLTAVQVDGVRVTVRVAASVEPWFPVLAARTVSSGASASATVGGGP